MPPNGNINIFRSTQVQGRFCLDEEDDLIEVSKKLVFIQSHSNKVEWDFFIYRGFIDCRNPLVY